MRYKMERKEMEIVVLIRISLKMFATEASSNGGRGGMEIVVVLIRISLKMVATEASSNGGMGGKEMEKEEG